MSGPRVLVAGIGNLFLGDDGFGCEVVRQLGARALPENVTLRDFGTRGRDLAYELASGWDVAVFIDAASRGGAPGTLYVIEPDPAAEGQPVESHALRLQQVLPLARSLGAIPATLRLVGCEPASLEGEDAGAGLSPAVAAAVPGAVERVEALLARLREPADA